MTIGEAIKQARINAKLTQTQLGEILGLPQSHICNFEKGKVQPEAKTMQNIADALGCEWDHRLKNRDKITIQHIPL